LFLCKGEYEQSIKFFEQAIKIAEEAHSPRLLLVAQVNKAKAFLKLDDIETAESIVRRIQFDKISKKMYCDIHIVKSDIHLKKNELELAEESIEKSLKLAKELHFIPLFAKALGTKALILLHEDMQPEALNCLETAKTMLLLKGEMPVISEILVNFGLFLGGSQGEAIFMEGLEMLFRMGATAKISRLYEVIKKENSFNDALKLIQILSHF
jgi:tetratricopeptide (TPR) repeat protein